MHFIYAYFSLFLAIKLNFDYYFNNYLKFFILFHSYLYYT